MSIQTHLKIRHVNKPQRKLTFISLSFSVSVNTAPVTIHFEQKPLFWRKHFILYFLYLIKYNFRGNEVWTHLTFRRKWMLYLLFFKYRYWRINPTRPKHYCIVWNEPPQALASMSMHTRLNICAIIKQATFPH